MPKRKYHPDDKLINKSQESMSGIIVAGGDVTQSNYDTSNWKELSQDYEEMRKSHPIISSTYEGLIQPIIGAELSIEPGNDTPLAKEAAKYIDWQFKNMYKGFQYFKRHLFFALPNGLSIFEKVYAKGIKYNGKTTNIIVKLAPIQNDTINRFYYDDKYGFFNGIQHEKRMPNGGNSLIDIDKDKLFYWAYNEEYDNITGASLLRPLRLSFLYQKEVLEALARGVSRMAGIPHGTLYGSAGDSDKANCEKLLRTLCNSKNTYVLDHEDRFKVELLKLEGIDNAQPLVEMFDRWIFFGLASEFKASGIGTGANGSRSGTESHKSPYELKLASIIQESECVLQTLTDEMIEISYLANKLSDDEYPVFKFNSITQSDLQRVAQTILPLYQNQIIQKQPEDEVFLRDMFGLPALQVKKEIQIVDDSNQEGLEQSEMKLFSLHRELTAHEKNVFEFESANEHYTTIQDKADAILSGFIKKELESIAEQIKTKDDISFEMKHKEELIKALQDLYSSSLTKGREDIKKELQKISNKPKELGKNQLEIKIKATNKGIDRWVTNLYNNLSTIIEDRLDKLPQSIIEKKGGIDAYINGFAEGFKKEKRNILTAVESGYSDGRGYEINENKDSIESFMYSAIFDKALCEECSKYDGLEMTWDDVEQLGFRRGQNRVNPNCLGNSGEYCRCNLIPYRTKE